MLGIWSGAFLHVLLAAIGISAILATSVITFAFVKWIGAIYLIGLGIKAFRFDGASYSSDTKVNGFSSKAFWCRL